MTKFPYISDERRREMLAPQPGRVRVVIDTDAANEVDDQFAITWGLLSPDDIVDSEGARRIIEAAMADDDRLLHVVAIGALTNIAAALLMEPEIITRMVVSWTSGFPTFVKFSNSPAMNLVQDQHASRLLFDSGVPLLYLPGYYIGEQLVMSLPESERWVNGRGEIGNYLHYLYTHNRLRAQRLVEPFPGQSWVCWDFINFAWLIDPTWVPTMFLPTPTLDDDLVWQHLPDRPLMSEATDVDRDAVYRDFFRKLDQHHGEKDLV